MRVQRTKIDNLILNAHELTWKRIGSDMSIDMQKALSILKDVMGNNYEEPAIVIWEGKNLIGVAVYETYDSAIFHTRETYIRQLASFTHNPGVGRMLVNEIIKLSKEEHCNFVGVSHGPGAKGFYEKLGFIEDKRLMPQGEVGTLMMYRINEVRKSREIG